MKIERMNEQHSTLKGDVEDRAISSFAEGPYGSPAEQVAVVEPPGTIWNHHPGRNDVAVCVCGW